MSCKPFLALFLFLLAARATGGSDQDSTEKTIDLVIRTLASEEMQGRRHLTPGGAKAREWLVGWLQANGFQPAGADGGFLQTFDQGVNILAVLRREGQENEAPAILISSHYDHHGLICDPHTHAKSETCNGAADNAGGVAVALASAKALAGKLHHPLAVALWDAEEFGLLGSRYFVAHPSFALDDLRLIVNMDIIGLDLFQGMPWNHFICGSESGGELLAQTLAAVLKDSPLQPIYLTYPFVNSRSDITAFLVGGHPVPFVFFSDGDGGVYHSWAEERDRINLPKVEAITAVVTEPIRQVDGSATPPVYSLTPQSMQMPGYQDAVNLAHFMEKIASVKDENGITGDLALDLEALQASLAPLLAAGPDQLSPQSALLMAKAARGIIGLSKKVSNAP